MEHEVYDLINAGIAVDLLVSSKREPSAHVGVRLRTFAKHLPPAKMVLAEGETFSDALGECIAKAQSGRWERLDWGARPWPVSSRAADTSPYGL